MRPKKDESLRYHISYDWDDTLGRNVETRIEKDGTGQIGEYAYRVTKKIKSLLIEKINEDPSHNADDCYAIGVDRILFDLIFQENIHNITYDVSIEDREYLIPIKVVGLTWIMDFEIPIRLKHDTIGVRLFRTGAREESLEGRAPGYKPLHKHKPEERPDFIDLLKKL